jgi:hypothetical protein
MLARLPNMSCPAAAARLPPGVLTKLDIMDRGTDAVAVLRNEAVPLALGFVGVVLRRWGLGKGGGHPRAVGCGGI